MRTIQKYLFPTWLSAAYTRLTGWLMALHARILPAQPRLVRIGSVYRDSRLLHMAIKLAIADEIADQPVSVGALSKALAVDSDNLYRLLRALAALDVFCEVKPQVFVNNRLSSLLRSIHKDNVRFNILIDHCKEVSSAWFDELETCFLSTRGVNARGSQNTQEHIQSDLLSKSAKRKADLLSDLDWSQFDFTEDAENQLA